MKRFTTFGAVRRNNKVYAINNKKIHNFFFFSLLTQMLPFIVEFVSKLVFQQKIK